MPLFPLTTIDRDILADALTEYQSSCLLTAHTLKLESRAPNVISMLQARASASADLVAKLRKL